MPFSDKAEILTVQPDEIGQYEKIALPFIVSALEHADGETSTGHILSDIATQQRQLWLIRADGEFIGAIVTQIYTTQAGKKIGEVTLAGGRDYHLWDHFIDVVGFWFKEKGCHAVRVIGRAGWERKLKGNGFKKAYTIFERALA
jgi:hypothetical protein